MTVLEVLSILTDQVPADFGDGWMSRNARDMLRIAAIAGFDMSVLLKRVALESNPRRTTNSATVERIMAEMIEIETAAASDHEET